jgi:hypothetical protein
VPEANDDRFFRQHSSLQNKLVIPRGFGLSRGALHTIGCCDRNTCYGQFLLRVGIALRHCAFNRDRSMDMKMSDQCSVMITGASAQAPGIKHPSHERKLFEEG